MSEIRKGRTQTTQKKIIKEVTKQWCDNNIKSFGLMAFEK